MKLLLTHRFFYPDTAPYGLMLRSIGDALAEAGHEVHILSSVPSYRFVPKTKVSPRMEHLGALHVKRIWVFGDEKRYPLRRLANVILFAWALFWTILKQRPDIVSASTFPPIIAAWCASIAARLTKAQFVYHVQDIHPEVSKFGGGMMGNGWLMRLLRWMDNQTLSRSDAIVVLSEDMANSLRERGLGPLPIHIINNLSLETSEYITKAPPDKLRKPKGKRRVIFAGNLGRFQQLPLLAEGVSHLFDTYPDIELLFLGNGSALMELKAVWKGHGQVVFADFLPFEQAKVLIQEADVGLVSLLPGMFRVAYPSKIISYAGLGLPMLVLVEPESELASSLQKSGVGKVPRMQTPEDIAATLHCLLQNPIDRSVVRSWHDNVACTKDLLNCWINLIAKLKNDTSISRSNNEK